MKFLMSSLLLFSIVFCGDVETNAQNKRKNKDKIKKTTEVVKGVATLAEEKAAIKNVINEVFEGMKESDSERVRAAFNTNARLNTSAVTPSGEGVFYVGGLEAFLDAVDAEHEEVWNEKITSTEILVDDNLAHAWAKYEFYLGEELIHCGVNSFQLVKLEGKWTIVNLIDTKRPVDKCR